MKIRKNKRGYYEEDNEQFKDWLLVLVAVVIVFVGFSYHLFTIIF